MQVEECVKKLKSKGIIDSREIYIYASLKNIIGGMFGSIRGLVLLCMRPVGRGERFGRGDRETCRSDVHSRTPVP